MTRILQSPDPILRQISEPVAAVTDDTRALIDEMVAAMRAGNGIGLAAIQIGVPLRIIVLEPKPGYVWAMVNPEITRTGDLIVAREEGCLSVPDGVRRIWRPDQIKVRFLDRDGKSRKTFAQGWFATSIQHEIDHLNGVLISDARTEATPT